MKRTSIIVLLMVLLVVIMPTEMLASSAQLSATAKTKLDQVVSDSDAKTASLIRTQLNSLHKTQEQELIWEEKIKAIHYQNEADLIQARKQIKMIGADKINKLELQVKTIKQKYKPLFDAYSSLNQQIDMARIVKNKNLNSILRTQADVMKVAVQLARNDIRNKEETLKKSKSDNTKTIKQLRETLSTIDPIKVKIKLEKSRMNTPKQRFSSEWKTLNAAIKKSDAKSILNSLTSLVTIALKVNEHNNKIHSYEKSISDIILSVKARIPKT